MVVKLIQFIASIGISHNETHHKFYFYVRQYKLVNSISFILWVISKTVKAIKLLPIIFIQY